MDQGKRQDTVAKIRKKPLITKTRKYESTKEEGVISKTGPFFVFSNFRAFGWVVSLNSTIIFQHS